MNLNELTTGQKVWIMYNNKPVELAVTKIVTTQELINNGGEVPVQNTVAYASYSQENRHEQTLIARETFATKDELRDDIFNQNQQKS